MILTKKFNWVELPCGFSKWNTQLWIQWELSLKLRQARPFIRVTGPWNVTKMAAHMCAMTSWLIYHVQLF